MATDGHPKELPKSQKPSDELTPAFLLELIKSLVALKTEILGAFQEMKKQPSQQDPRDRKTETISVLRSALTVHDEIASQRKVCQEEFRQAYELQLDLFHANHIKPLLADINTLRQDIEAMCSDAETTTKSIRNGNAETNSSIGTVQQTLQGLCAAVFGRRNDKGDVEVNGLDAVVKALDTWKSKQEAAERLLEAKKGDFRYWIDVVMKVVFWAGPLIISALTLWYSLFE